MQCYKYRQFANGHCMSENLVNTKVIFTVQGNYTSSDTGNDIVNDAGNRTGNNTGNYTSAGIRCPGRDCIA